MFNNVYDNVFLYKRQKCNWQKCGLSFPVWRGISLNPQYVVELLWILLLRFRKTLKQIAFPSLTAPEVSVAAKLALTWPNRKAGGPMAAIHSVSWFRFSLSREWRSDECFYGFYRLRLQNDVAFPSLTAPQGECCGQARLHITEPPSRQP